MRHILPLLLALAIPTSAHAESWWYHYCSSNCAEYSSSEPTYQCKEGYDYYSGDYHAWRDNYEQPTERFHKCCAKAKKQSCSRPSKQKGQSEAEYVWKKLFDLAGERAMQLGPKGAEGGGTASADSSVSRPLWCER